MVFELRFVIEADNAEEARLLADRLYEEIDNPIHTHEVNAVEEFADD